MLEIANRDISYCNGDNCSKKYQCLRYLGLYEKMSEWISIIDSKGCIEDDYFLFMSAFKLLNNKNNK